MLFHKINPKKFKSLTDKQVDSLKIRVIEICKQIVISSNHMHNFFHPEKGADATKATLHLENFIHYLDQLISLIQAHGKKDHSQYLKETELGDLRKELKFVRNLIKISSPNGN